MKAALIRFFIDLLGNSLSEDELGLLAGGPSTGSFAWLFTAGDCTEKQLLTKLGIFIEQPRKLDSPILGTTASVVFDTRE